MVATATPPIATTPNPPTDLVDIPRIFAQQQQFWPEVRNATVEQRIRKLYRLRATVLERRKDIEAAAYADFRKPPIETAIAEINFIVAECKFAARNLRKWMQPKRVPTPITYWGTKSEIRYEPKGVALIISPWNYPFSLTLAPLVGALAAGCCAVIKPSEYTPHSSRLMREMITELFDPREVTVIEGDYTASQALLTLPFNHIYFTGSPEVGKLVMRAAAEHLASVTLELGGKSPTIVDDTADVPDAAQKIAWGKYTNSGQTCIAPDYVLVHERVHDEFVRRLRNQINTFYGQAPAQQQSASYARMVNDRHYRRVQHLYEAAVAGGAKVTTGGVSDPVDRWIAPTVLTNVPLDSDVMQEEIFGPVLPVVPFRTLDDALGVINGKPNPLALYVFSKDEDHIAKVLNETTAGSTCINETMLQFLQPELPFGGAGYSGMGRGYGHAGFLAFSNERAVLRRTWASPLMQLLLPPYGKGTQRLVGALLKYF